MVSVPLTLPVGLAMKPVGDPLAVPPPPPPPPPLEGEAPAEGVCAPPVKETLGVDEGDRELLSDTLGEGDTVGVAGVEGVDALDAVGRGGVGVGLLETHCEVEREEV